MTIDAGETAIDRATISTAQTYIDGNNSANATGLIFEISIYSNVALEGIEVASFIQWQPGVNDFTTRANVSLANQGGAGLTTYTAPTDFIPFEIRSGDWIGIYFTAGEIDADTGGEAGYWFKNADCIPCTEETFVFSSPRRQSLYATGYQLGQLNIGDAWKDIQNIQINVGDAWKQITLGSKINIGDVWKEILH